LFHACNSKYFPFGSRPDRASFLTPLRLIAFRLVRQHGQLVA
jgi:hypothetical protein